MKEALQFVNPEQLKPLIPQEATSSFTENIPEDIRKWVIGMLRESNIKFVRISLPYTKFQTGATTLDVALFTLPNYGELLTGWMNVINAFAGPATVTMSIGPNGSETTIQTAQNVKTTGIKKAVGTDFTTGRGVYSTTSKTVIEARITAATNTSNLTAGLIEFCFAYIDHVQNR